MKIITLFLACVLLVFSSEDEEYSRINVIVAVDNYREELTREKLHVAQTLIQGLRENSRMLIHWSLLHHTSSKGVMSRSKLSNVATYRHLGDVKDNGRGESLGSLLDHAERIISEDCLMRKILLLLTEENRLKEEELRLQAFIPMCTQVHFLTFNASIGEGIEKEEVSTLKGKLSNLTYNLEELDCSSCRNPAKVLWREEAITSIVKLREELDEQIEMIMNNTIILGTFDISLVEISLFTSIVGALICVVYLGSGRIFEKIRKNKGKQTKPPVKPEEAKLLEDKIDLLSIAFEKLEEALPTKVESEVDGRETLEAQEEDQPADNVVHSREQTLDAQEEDQPVDNVHSREQTLDAQEEDQAVDNVVHSSAVGVTEPEVRKDLTEGGNQDPIEVKERELEPNAQLEREMPYESLSGTETNDMVVEPSEAEERVENIESDESSSSEERVVVTGENPSEENEVAAPVVERRVDDETDNQGLVEEEEADFEIVQNEEDDVPNDADVDVAPEIVVEESPDNNDAIDDFYGGLCNGEEDEEEEEEEDGEDDDCDYLPLEVEEN